MNRSERILNWCGIVLCILIAALSVIQLAAGGFQWQFVLCSVVALAVANSTYRKLKHG
jgi:membrane protein implicated in regulation of membrane protease activity